jgi:transposase
MGYNFYPVDRDQPFLFPPSLRDWLPTDDPVWFVIDAVDGMDLSAFYAKYRSDGAGATAYEPSMMVSLLVYAYCHGERSSRKIEWLCERDVAFRVIAANKVPDHSSICRFRSTHDEALGALFMDVLRLCAKAKLVKLGLVALDGTKMKAVAALEANRTEDGLEAEVRKILREAKAVDEEENRLYGDKRGDEVPEELRTKKGRMERLAQCREQLAKEKAEAAAKQQAKLDRRAEEEKETGKKKRGRKPKPPDAKKEDPAKANVTDPESRIMKTRSGYIQGYNGQIVVTKEQIVIAAEVTQEANDVRQLEPMVELARQNVRAVMKDGACEMGSFLADAGYWSDGNAAYAKDAGPDFHIATNKDWKQRKAMREAPPPRGRIPGGLPPRELMERKLLTKAGRAIYRMRGQTVEPVFGQAKSADGFDRFSRRGKKACQNEWKFYFAIFNLKKLWRHTMNEAVKREAVSAIQVKNVLQRGLFKVRRGLSDILRAACLHFGSHTPRLRPT